MKEISIADLIDIISENWKTIILVTTLFLIVSTVISVNLPKTFESDALIKLGKANKQPVFSQVDAKNLIKSSIILDGILNKFSTEHNQISAKDFINNNLKIELVSEIVIPNYHTLSSFIRITVKANDAAKSKDIALAISNAYLEYEGNELKKRKDLLLQEYNEFTLQNNEKFTNQTAVLNNLLEESKKKIESIKKEISDLDSQINALQSSANSDTLSKTIALISIKESYDSMLATEENKKNELEKELLDKKSALDENLANKKAELKENESKFEDGQLVSPPLIPKKASNPNVPLNVIISGLVGLLISIFYFIVIKK